MSSELRVAAIVAVSERRRKWGRGGHSEAEDETVKQRRRQWGGRWDSEAEEETLRRTMRQWSRWGDSEADDETVKQRRRQWAERCSEARKVTRRRKKWGEQSQVCLSLMVSIHTAPTIYLERDNCLHWLIGGTYYTAFYVMLNYDGCHSASFMYWACYDGITIRECSGVDWYSDTFSVICGAYWNVRDKKVLWEDFPVLPWGRKGSASKAIDLRHKAQFLC